MITVLPHLLSGYRWGNGLGNQAVVTPAAATFGKLISPALSNVTARTN